MPSNLLLPTLREYFEKGEAIWNKNIMSFPPEPSPAEPPLECYQYIVYANRSWAAMDFYIVVIMFMTCLCMSVVISAVFGVLYRHLVRRLAEATPENREKELKRLCKHYGIKIRKEEKRFKAKKGGKGKGDELSIIEKGGSQMSRSSYRERTRQSGGNLFGRGRQG